MCGASPVEASSGKTVRHRLNRGGNRQANHALWRIVMVRLTCDPATQAYAERRRAEGKSDREIVRCLKRYVAREVYRYLVAPEAVPAGADLDVPGCRPVSPSLPSPPSSAPRSTRSPGSSEQSCTTRTSLGASRACSPLLSQHPALSLQKRLDNDRGINAIGPTSCLAQLSAFIARLAAPRLP
jgi:hypothetical protein